MNPSKDNVGDNTDLSSIIDQFPKIRYPIPPPISQQSKTTLDDANFFPIEKGSMWAPSSIIQSKLGVPTKIKLEIVKRDTSLYFLLCRFLSDFLEILDSCDNSPLAGSTTENKYLISAVKQSDEDIL